jgi:PKD repeat protein/KaiC/GvpD/RAD55 family RecA-like ATPase
MKLSGFTKSMRGSRPFSTGRTVEAILVALILLTMCTLLFPRGFTDDSRLCNRLVFAEAPTQRRGKGIAAITDTNHTTAYNPSQWNLVGSTTYISGSVSDLAADDSNSAVFGSYNLGATNTTVNYFPNSSSSDADGNGNLGAHSNFTAMAYGPDGTMDRLTEVGVGGSAEQWVLPTGYQDPSSAWTSETLAYDNNVTTASSSSIDSGNWSGYLYLNSSALTCSTIGYCVGRSQSQVDRIQIDIYNGTWTNVLDGNGPWDTWSNVSFASVSVTQMRIRFLNNHPSKSQTAFIYEAQFLQSAVLLNYQLDLEVQWTGVNYTMANNWLCIYGGTMSTQENCSVDVWNGSAWNNVIASLSSNWDNVSVSSYLVSSNFTIRFRDATPNDHTQDSWQVDVCLLQVWTGTVNQYAAEVEFSGSSDLQNWTLLVWQIDSAWNTDSVNVTIQFYNYTLGGYVSSGTGYISYTSSSTPNTDELKSQTIASNPTSFRNSTGYWKVKIKGVKPETQFQMKVDWIQFQDTCVVQDIPPVAQFSVSARTVTTGISIQLDASASYDVDGTITSYAWTFGDGNTAVGKTTSHAYAENGTYAVVLTVTDNDGSTSTAQDTITVQDRPPIAQFSVSARTVATEVFVQFNASSSYDPDGTIVSYYWDFGDGQNGMGRVASHAYGDNGTYTVALTVTDNDGLTNTTRDTVLVQDKPPIALFTVSANVVDTGVFIQFDASSSYDPDGTVIGFYWDFGDGKNATGKVVSHSYAYNGTYTVALTATDDDGLTDVHLDTITVHNRPPIASFTVSSVTVYTDEIITLNATFSHDPDGSVVSFFWDFGDGANASGVVVSHAYAQNGTYAITLTVTDDAGSVDSAVTTERVLNPAGPDLAPIAIFNASPSTVYTGENVLLDASGSYDPDGTITNYAWNLGDNSTTTGKTATHTYAEDGIYMITLTVTDNSGTINATMEVVSVLDRAPSASFTSSSGTVHTGEAVVFNASTSFDPDGTIIFYFWDFGDGVNATGAIASHAYAYNGTYSVILTVTDDDGKSDSNVAAESVLNRVGAEQPPVASLIVSAQTIYTRETIVFNSSGSYDPDGTIASYLWDFGDNSSKTGDSVVDHVYDENGNFLVKLTVVDNDGSTDSTNTTIIVLDRPPCALFAASTMIAHIGEPICLNASMSYDPDGTVTDYFWDFGDQLNATGVVVNHAYVRQGNYTVVLTITDNDGSSNTTSTLETILSWSTVASFTISPTQPRLNDLITFNASGSFDPSSTITNYRWDFGDGNTTETSAAEITHAYSEPGNFNVTLTVFNVQGYNCSTSKLVSLSVHDVAIVSVSLSSSKVQIGQTVNITVRAKNNGMVPESFNVTVFRNETTIGSQLVSNLAPGGEQLLVFYWDTSSTQIGATFLIQAKADNVTGEIEIADNTCRGGVVNLIQASGNGSFLPSFDWTWVGLLIIPLSIVPLAGFMLKRRGDSPKGYRAFEHFDEITGGGIPDSFSVLVIGEPGSGKSILCQELAYSFLAKDRSCLYVAYDSFPDEIRDNLKKFGQETSGCEADRQFLFVDCYSSIARVKSKEEYSLSQPFSLTDLGITLSEATGEMGAHVRVILDSIVPLLTHVEPLKVIEFLQDRSARIKGINGAFIFTAGKETIELSLANRLEEAVDCIIELEASSDTGKSVRKLRVKKMKGRKTSEKWVRFEIDSSKGIVFPA